MTIDITQKNRIKVRIYSFDRFLTDFSIFQRNLLSF